MANAETTESQFRFAPLRQEVNWRCARRLFAWSYVLMSSGIVAITVWLGALPSGSAIIQLATGIIGVVLVFGGALLGARPAVEFLLKAIEARRIRARQLAFAVEEEKVNVYESGHCRLSIPRNQIVQIQIWREHGDVVGLNCGVGFVLSEIDGISSDREILRALEKNYAERGVHVWSRAAAIGKRQQFEAWIKWLKANDFSDRISNVQMSQDACLPWNRECWIIFATVSILLILAIWAVIEM